MKIIETMTTAVISEVFPIKSLAAQKKFIEDIDVLVERGLVDLIFDMNKVEYLMTIELGSLVAVMKKVRAKGGALKLVEVGEFLDNLLNLTNLKSVFELYATKEEALKGLAQDSAEGKQVEDNMKIGELLLQEDIIAYHQLRKALDYQNENPEVRIGVALVKLGFIDVKTIGGTLVKQKPPPNNQIVLGQPVQEPPAKISVPTEQGNMMKLGETLLVENIINEEELKKSLAHQEKHPGTMLGQALTELGLVTEKDISQTLLKMGQEE